MATVTLTARYLDQLKSHGNGSRSLTRLSRDWRSACQLRAARRSRCIPHHSRMRRVGLGRYPDVLLEKARKIATQHRGRIFDGADPARREADRARAGRAHGAGALRGSIAAGRRRSCGAGPRSVASWRRKSFPSGGIGGLWISDAVTSASSSSSKAQMAPIQGNRVLERISALFTFAVDQDWIEANPAWRIKKPGHERSRDRVLTRDELRDSGPRCMRPRPRTPTVHRSRDSRRR